MPQSIQDFLNQDFRIFVDTCSILYDHGEAFWSNAIQVLDQNERHIIVPLAVMRELEKQANKNDSSLEVVQRARRMHDVILQLADMKLVKIFGDSNENFADNVFQYIFTRYRTRNKLLLITQDNDLAKDILRLNETNAVRTMPILAKRIDPSGNLIGYGWESNINSNPSSNPIEDEWQAVYHKMHDDIQPFQICDQITDVKDIPLKIAEIPSENSILYESNQKQIRILKAISEGGEGIIYSTDDPNQVAKVYKTDKLTMWKFLKLKLMLTRKIRYEGICYPTSALYNSKQGFVGFLMPKAEGRELQRSIFRKELQQKYFPNWKKRDMVELCLTILEKIRYLHSKNILIGDINPANILVVSPKKVYFVDVDSYQIENFPCPVGTINFTAPEIQQKIFTTFLRSMGNEKFAIATLLFMIMLPGKSPYAQQGGEDQSTNIMNMNFSYPFGEKSNQKAPEGPWRFMWSHMTPVIKEHFYETFRKDGKFSQENSRLGTRSWWKLFKKYLDDLDNGSIGKIDKMSEGIYPRRLKKYIPKNQEDGKPEIKYVPCEDCGDEFREEHMKYGLCYDCRSQVIEEYECERCHEPMVYTVYEKRKNGKRYSLCSKCNQIVQQEKIQAQEKNRIVYEGFCVQCGRKFTVSQSEADFFKSRGLDIPKRCQRCRSGSNSSDDQNSSETSKKSFGSRILDLMNKIRSHASQR